VTEVCGEAQHNKLTALWGIPATSGGCHRRAGEGASSRASWRNSAKAELMMALLLVLD